MSHFETNVSILVERYPRFAEEIVDIYDPEELELVEIADGPPSAKLRGLLLHSARNPVREAERTVSGVTEGGTIACVSLGFGLGYYAEAVQRKYADLPIFIVEPDVAIFLGALKARNFTGLFADPRVSLILGVEPAEAAQSIASVPPGEIYIVAPRSLRRSNLEYFEELETRLDRLISRRHINKNTLEKFGNRWIKNLSLNFPAMVKAKPVSILERFFEGIPAIVLAAGPSLNDVLPKMSRLAERAVVIAVDTSCKACTRADVEPDFAVVVDPQYWNTRHLDRSDTTHTVLIFESSTYPTVLRRRYRDLMFCSSLFPLGEYIERSVGSFGKVGAGGSVATTAWDFARFLGCSPIYSAGLDLGFPENQTHYRGSTFEERAHLLASRCTPAEHASFLALRDAEPYFVPSSAGGEVLTDRRLIIYRWWFENQLETYPEIACFSFSQHGVAIAGMPFVSADTLLASLPPRGLIERRTQMLELFSQCQTDRSGLLTRRVNELIDELAAIETLAGSAIIVLGNAQKNGRIGTGQLVDLEDIDKEIRESGGKQIVSFLIQNIIEEISTSRPSVHEREAIETSFRLYTTIEESCRFHIAQLRRGLQFFGQE